MLVVDAGDPIRLRSAAQRAEITDEDGRTRRSEIVGECLGPLDQPGYYDLALDGEVMRLAVAPRRCPLPQTEGRRPWGVSLQIPALRSDRPSAFGTFAELASAIPALAASGADAVAINPVHALFPGHGANFSPYSPSSRIFLNGAMADPALAGLPALPPSEGKELIDWRNGLPHRLAALRDVFDGLAPAQRERVRLDSVAGGEALQRHALFDALDCNFRPGGAHGWRDWPAAFRDPDSAEVARFAAQHEDEIDFHLFVQWLARQGLDAAQDAAIGAGMAIGLVADLAVGVDPSGSDAWSLGEAMLGGLTIGAPPDPLGPHGQNWSITGFSPEGLRRTDYQPWIAMLRSALSSSGGLRIDHAFGLARLWVIPEGGASSDGAYLTYPFEDLVRIATLEAHRAGAMLIAEDLGTAPSGFTRAVTDRAMLGMRVLWFERAEDDGFIGARDYEPLSAAMTGTHDTVTVAGWWSGRDLDWAEQLGRLPSGMDRAKAEEVRAWDRGLLWSTIGDGSARPEPEDTDPVVDAAIAHVARTPSALAVVPLEDLLGEREQPNLPGTIAEHPNWRRRSDAPLQDLLARPEVARRCEALRDERRKPR